MLIIFLWWSEGSHLLLDLIQAKNIWLMEQYVIVSKWKQAIHIRSQKTWNCLRQCLCLMICIYIHCYICMFFHFAALYVVLRRIFFSALLFPFQSFWPLLLCFIVSWRLLFSSRAFLFLSSFFSLITSVSLCVYFHQTNPILQVMSRFVNLDSSTLFQKCSFFRTLDPLWVFCLKLLWSCFGSSCGYPWNGLTESADQTSFHCFLMMHSTFTVTFVLWMYSALFSPADEKQFNVSSERGI